MNTTQTLPNHTHTFRSLRDVVTGQAHAYCVHIPCQVTFELTETFEGERDSLDGLSQPAPATGSICPTCGQWADPWGDHRRRGCTDTTVGPATRTVTAEKAPVGVLLWPVRSPVYAENFTLAEVNVYLTESREVRVMWLYQSGKRRYFAVGEQVVIQASA